MTSEQFTYWLQGFIEIADPDNITEKEILIIKDHLAEVFKKETPIRTQTSSSKGLLSELGLHPVVPDITKAIIC